MYASLLARQDQKHDQKKSQPEIEALLEHYLQSIFELMCTLNEATFKDAQVNTHSPFIRFLAKSHDFYCMASLLHAGEGIADEVAVKLMTYFRAKNKLTAAQKITLLKLTRTEWWKIFIEILSAKPQFYAELDRETGRRGVPLSAGDATIKHLTNAYGILGKFLTYVLPALLEITDGKPMFRAPIADALDPNLIKPNSDQALSMAALERLGSIALLNLPSIFLANVDSLTSAELYRYFSEHKINFEYINARYKPDFNYNYIPCQNIKKGTLVFISDFMQNHNEWYLVASRFFQDHDVLLIDHEIIMEIEPSLPGPILGISTLKKIAGTINRLLTSLKIENPHIAGHGFGGLLALDLYQQIRSKGKLILLNTPLSITTLSNLEKMPAFFLAGSEASEMPISTIQAMMFFRLYADLFYSKAFSDKCLLELQSNNYCFQKQNFKILTNTWKVYKIFLANLEIETIKEYLSQNVSKILFLYSENDQLVSNSQSILLELDRLPFCSRLEDVGHGVLDEKPLIVVDKIREHLDPFATTSSLQRTHSSRM